MTGSGRHHRARLHRESAAVFAVVALAAWGCSSYQTSTNNRAGGPPGSSADAVVAKKFNSTEFLCVQPEPSGSALALDGTPVTYDGQISALLAASCTSCHKPGATAPDLSTFAGASANGAASLAAIQGGTMPTSGTLSAAQQALFLSWSNGGFLQDAPATAPSPAPAAPSGSVTSDVSPLCGVPATDTAVGTSTNTGAAGGTSTGTGSSSGTGTGTSTSTEVTYTANISALLNKDCATSGCHVPGAQAPDLSTYAAAQAAGATSEAAITGGSMPPAGALSGSDQALFKAWVDDNYAQ